MSKAATQQAEVVEKRVPVVLKPEIPRQITTKWGPVMVFGHELVSLKDIDIIGHCLSLPEFDERPHGVKSIVFRDDGYPKRDGKMILAACVSDTSSMAINLVRTIEVALNECIKHPEVALQCAFHQNLILNYLHEIHHLSTTIDTEARQILDNDPQARKEEETVAEKWSMDMLYWLGQNVDIEPPHIADMNGFLNGEIQDIMEPDAEDTQEDDEWGKKQKHMLRNRIMYSLDESSEGPAISLNTFKAYLHNLANDPLDDPKWNKRTDGADVANQLAELERKIAEIKGRPTEGSTSTALDQPSVAAVQEDEPPWVDEDAEVAMAMDNGPEATGNIEEVHAMYEQQAVQPQFCPQTGRPLNAAAQAIVAQNQTVVQPSAEVTEAYQQVVADQTRKEVPVFQHTGLTSDQTKDVVFGVYNKIYQHFFGICEPQQNSDVGFANVDAIVASPIQLDATEQAVIPKCDCSDINGKWCGDTPTSDGFLRGQYLINKSLPGYKFYINDNGNMLCRFIIPQNVNKRHPQTGELSKPAQAARQGSCIMYVFEGDDEVKKRTGKSYLYKCIDGVWEVCK